MLILFFQYWFLIWSLLFHLRFYEGLQKAICDNSWAPSIEKHNVKTPSHIDSLPLCPLCAGNMESKKVITTSKNFSHTPAESELRQKYRPQCGENKSIRQSKHSTGLKANLGSPSLEEANPKVDVEEVSLGHLFVEES